MNENEMIISGSRNCKAGKECHGHLDGAMTLGIMTLSITTLSIMAPDVGCHYAECHYAECRGAIQMSMTLFACFAVSASRYYHFIIIQ